MTATQSRPRCCYCGNQLYTRAERPDVEPGNLLTRDHIVPRACRRPLPDDVRTTRRCCHACNQLRAQLGHCPAMLAIAREMAQAWRLQSRREAARAMFFTAKPRAGLAVGPRAVRTWSPHATLRLHPQATEAERLHIARIALAGTGWRIAPRHMEADSR